MFKSIKFKLIAGLLTAIIIPMGVIFAIVADNIADLSYTSYVEAARVELAQVENAVSIFLENVQENVTMMALSPAALNVHDKLPSYVDAKKVDKRTVPPSDDAVGTALHSSYRTLTSSHPGYMDAYIGTKYGGLVSSADGPLPAGFDPRKRPWYKESAQAPQKAIVSKAYMSANGMPCISVARGVAKDGDLLGVVALDLSLVRLTDLVKSIAISETGYVMLVQDDGVIISDPRNQDLNFKNIKEVDRPGLAALFEKESGALDFELDGRDVVGAVLTSPKYGWRVISLIDKSELTAPVRATVGKIGLIMIAGLFAITVFIWLFFDKTVLKPLNAVAAMLGRIAEGDYDVGEGKPRSDEIGLIFKALGDMARTLKQNIEEITAKTEEAQEKARAAEEATARAEEAQQQADTARREGLRHAAERVEMVLERVASASGEMSRQSDELLRGTEVQSERIASTATAMEEMNSTVLEIAGNAGAAAGEGVEAREKARNGAGVVEKSQEALNQTVSEVNNLKDSMQELDHQAQGIGAIIGVINDIADQTNLLALNAAIEAARAGEAGRGFAVVADEVRKLAEKTMTATKEVSDSIGSIQKVAGANITSMEMVFKRIAEANEYSAGSGTMLEEIVAGAEASAAQIRSIAAAAEQQSAASEQINSSIEEINRITMETAEGAGEFSNALHGLAEQVSELQNIVGDLKSEGGNGARPLPA